jgi:hypothetical protein
MGVGAKTIDRDVGIASNDALGAGDAEGGTTAAASNDAPALSGAEAATAVERAERKAAAAEEIKARREASRSAEPLADGMELRIGDCRTVLADVPDNSVPLILTDPPHQREGEALYRWLAEWSAHVLIPAGFLDLANTSGTNVRPRRKPFTKPVRAPQIGPARGHDRWAGGSARIRAAGRLVLPRPVDTVCNRAESET